MGGEFAEKNFFGIFWISAEIWPIAISADFRPNISKHDPISKIWKSVKNLDKF